jgi:hypothetical protein
VKLPTTVYVAVKTLVDDEPYLSAEASVAALMEDDGPLLFGVYQLVETQTAEKHLTLKHKTYATTKPQKKPRKRSR